MAIIFFACMDHLLGLVKRGQNWPQRELRDCSAASEMKVYYQFITIGYKRRVLDNGLLRDDICVSPSRDKIMFIPKIGISTRIKIGFIFLIVVTILISTPVTLVSEKSLITHAMERYLYSHFSAILFNINSGFNEDDTIYTNLAGYVPEFMGDYKKASGVDTDFYLFKKDSSPVLVSSTTDRTIDFDPRYLSPSKKCHLMDGISGTGNKSVASCIIAVPNKKGDIIGFMLLSADSSDMAASYRQSFLHQLILALTMMVLAYVAAHFMARGISQE